MYRDKHNKDTGSCQFSEDAFNMLCTLELPPSLPSKDVKGGVLPITIHSCMDLGFLVLD